MVFVVVAFVVSIMESFVLLLFLFLLLLFLLFLLLSHTALTSRPLSFSAVAPIPQALTRTRTPDARPLANLVLP